MMKIKNIFLVFIVSALVFTSCDDFLDVVPDSRVELKDESHLRGLLAGALPNASYYSFAHSLSDNAGDAGASGFKIPTNEEAYKFKKFTQTGQDSPFFYWMSCYEAIAKTNLVIEFIDKFKDDKIKFKQYQHIYGEALIARAYNHFMLANLWCQPYNPNTADKDLGIPYVTKPEKTVLVKYKRGTLSETYKKIEADLLEGMPLLNDEKQEFSSFHFTTKSANAFASRFFLYKGEWDNVIAYSTAFLGTNIADKLRDWTGEYSNFTSSQLSLYYASSKEKANLLISCGMSTFSSTYKSQRYGLTGYIRNHIYINKDLISGGQYLYKFRGFDKPDRVFVEKYRYIFQRLGVNAQIGYYYINNVLFSAEEVLFNYIEALIMKDNDASYNKAISMFDNFFSKRVDNGIANYDPIINKVKHEKIEELYKNSGDDISSWYSINAKQKLYLKALLDVRRAEFMFEGQRWFDIRRFNIAVTHRDEAGNYYKLEKQDKRKVLQIPEDAILLGLEPNPEK